MLAATLYAAFVYVEDSAGNTDGSVSRPVSLMIDKTNTFTRGLDPVAVDLYNLTVRFAAAQPAGVAWAMVADAAVDITPMDVRGLNGALGGASCRLEGVGIGDATVTLDLHGCGMALGSSYLMYVYVEGQGAGVGSGALSGPMFLTFSEQSCSPSGSSVGDSGLNASADDLSSNSFATPVRVYSTPLLSELELAFTPRQPGYAWGAVVPAGSAGLVNAAALKNGLTIEGHVPCWVAGAPVSNASVQTLSFRGCALQAGVRVDAFDFTRYQAVVYVEGANYSGDGSLSEPVEVGVIGALSNWFLDSTVRLSPPSPEGVAFAFRAAKPEGRMWAMVTRFLHGVDVETVQASRSAVGGDACRIQSRAIDNNWFEAQLSDCGFEPGTYYYLHVYVSGPGGFLDGAASPPLELQSPVASNSFVAEPRLLATATADQVQIGFTALQAFGKAWVGIFEARDAAWVTVEVVKSLNGTVEVGDISALGGYACQLDSASIDSTEQALTLEGCGLEPGGLYTGVVYVEDSNGRNDGTLATVDVLVRPVFPASNMFASGPVFAETPTSDLVRLRFRPARAGKYWAFVLPSDSAALINTTSASDPDSIPDVVSSAGCLLTNVSMPADAVELDLVDCGLVDAFGVSVVTSYSVLVYIEDYTGPETRELGSLSAVMPLLPVSNTFLEPLPRLKAHGQTTPTPGDIVFDVTPRVSGKLWAAVYESKYVTSVERYTGVITLHHLKAVEAYENMGPSYGNPNCSVWGMDINATDEDNASVTTEIRLTGCALQSEMEMDYSVLLYVEACYNTDFGATANNGKSCDDYEPFDPTCTLNDDADFTTNDMCCSCFSSQGRDDGQMIGLDLGHTFADSSNYFAVAPTVSGVPTSDAVTLRFQAASPGEAWCAIVSPEAAENATVPRVRSAEFSLGSSSCCQRTTGKNVDDGVTEWRLTGCGLSVGVTYEAFVYIERNGEVGTLSPGFQFMPEGATSYLRLRWQDEGTDASPVEQWRVYLNGSVVYDDNGLRSSLEQEREIGRPGWIRVVDVVCQPGFSYEVTIAGRNLAGWSNLSEPLIVSCFFVPGAVEDLHLKPGSTSQPVGINDAALEQSATIEWAPPANLDGAVTYNVYRDGGLARASFELVASTSEPHFVDSELVAGRVYNYRVSAANSVGEGVVSSSFSLTAPGYPSPASVPTVVRVSRREVEIAWSAESVDGDEGVPGSAATGYAVLRDGQQIFPDNGTADTSNATGAAVELSSGVVGDGITWEPVVPDAQSSGGAIAVGGARCELDGLEGRVVLSFVPNVSGLARVFVTVSSSTAERRGHLNATLFGAAVSDSVAEAMAVVTTAATSRAAGVPAYSWHAAMEASLSPLRQGSADVAAVLARHGWRAGRFGTVLDLDALHEDLALARARLGVDVEGESTCRSSNIVTAGVQQQLNLTGCHLTEGSYYNALIFLEGSDDGSEIMTRYAISVCQVVRSAEERNTFVDLPSLWSLDAVGGDALSIRLVANEGFAWAVVVDSEELAAAGKGTFSAKDVVRASYAVGRPSCRSRAVPIDGGVQILELSGCGLLVGRLYLTFVYVGSTAGGPLLEEAPLTDALLLANGTLAAGPEVVVPDLAVSGFQWSCHGTSCPSPGGLPVIEEAAGAGVALVPDLDGRVAFEVVGWGPGEAAQITVRGPAIVSIENVSMPAGTCSEASLTASALLGGAGAADPLRTDLSIHFCGSDFELPYHRHRRLAEGEAALFSWRSAAGASRVGSGYGWRVALAPPARAEISWRRRFRDRAAEEGVEHTYQVRGQGQFGLGAASAPSRTALVADPPAAPPRPRVTAQSSYGISLAWGLAASGGAPVLEFVLYQRLSSRGAAGDEPPGPWVEAYRGPARAHTARPVRPGRAYDFAVAAANLAGEGAPSEVLGRVWACSAPGPVEGLRVGGQSARDVLVEWRAPRDEGGCPLTSLGLQLPGLAERRLDPSAGGRVRLTEGDGLARGESSVVGLNARNAAGVSATATVTVHFFAAPAVVELSASVHDADGIQLHWELAAGSSGPAVTGYRVYVDLGWGVERLRTVMADRDACSVAGGPASYTETVAGGVRSIQGAGCPNHFNACQKPRCDGTSSDAVPTVGSYSVLEEPMLLPNGSFSGSMRCSPSSLGVALNGVPIAGPAGTSASSGGGCGDFVSESAGSIDACGGFADASGVYRYHMLPVCFLAQLGAVDWAHSPQVGWSLDGFPIYGPRGPGGVAMVPCSIRARHLPPGPCLDPCGGYESALPEVDSFLYRYYLPGPLGDLGCGQLCDVAGGAGCCAQAVPGPELFPYTLGCFRGCTQAEVDAGRCSGTSGLAGPAPPASEGVVASYTHPSLVAVLESVGVQESRGSLTLSRQEILRLRDGSPVSPEVCFQVGALSAATALGLEPELSQQACVPLAQTPTEPSGLRALRRTRGAMTLTWDESVTDATHPLLGYRVRMRSAGSGAGWQTLALTLPGSRRAVVDPCEAGALYELEVLAESGAGWSRPAAATLACAVAPGPPLLSLPSARLVRGREGLACRWALSWAVADDGGAPVLLHRLYRAGAAGPHALVYEGALPGFTDVVQERPEEQFSYVAAAVNEAVPIRGRSGALPAVLSSLMAFVPADATDQASLSAVPERSLTGGSERGFTYTFYTIFPEKLPGIRAQASYAFFAVDAPKSHMLCLL
ncbi:unnamed protein product [Prorocentrum cordatum]|uniref:Fibronectin type-III domain-containing protein n=1 Tax=Prorocentrum cordatum TaxID=2364126 RepID=A0ABN9UPN3_9DINO|nr:unnamed protein product [Polarella glacialis]